MAYQKILVPLDGSDLAEKALPYTKALAKLKNSEVILFAVSITPEGYRRDRLLRRDRFRVGFGFWIGMQRYRQGYNNRVL